MAESAAPSTVTSKLSGERASATLESRIGLIAILGLAAGFILRLSIARSRYLVADEALDYLLVNQPSFLEAYRASLTNAHPPLYYFVLYYMRSLGTSELMLRLPSVLAGTLTPWFAFLWLKRLGRVTAFVALLLLTFAPALIAFSTEMRPYALLLLFLAAALWSLDRAFEKNSFWEMLLFGLFLCLANLTQYSAMWATVAMDIYALARIFSGDLRKTAIFGWITSQACTLMVLGFLWVTHISRMYHDAIRSVAEDGWLRAEYFQAGENVFHFALRATEHAFFYLLTRQKEISLTLAPYSVAIVLAIVLLFVFGVAPLLIKPAGDVKISIRSARIFGALILLPFLIGCAGALLRLYPYGGSRHVAYLAPFAAAGIASGIVWLSRRTFSIAVAATLALLLVCAWRVEPLSYISPADQASKQMAQALAYIHETVPRGGIVVVDYNSSLVLRYYLCPDERNSVRTFENEINQFGCAQYRMARARGYDWAFTSENLGPILAGMERQFGWQHEQPIWLVQAAEMRFDSKVLARFGAKNSKEFGLNVSVTRLRAP
ncbi:MAG TPA: glycosyltransferase family 39 protein [Verrucomicrobiae bacterium]|nr:glycosyltransferase family 39 protein [Verrucomicrobiae bacterium]